MKNNNDLYQLLHIIKFDGNIKKLTRNEKDYVKITENIKYLIESKLLSYIEEKLELTEKGEKIFKEFSLKYKNKNKDSWIEKENESKMEKLDLYFVYLPSQEDLNF